MSLGGGKIVEKVLLQVSCPRVGKLLGQESFRLDPCQDGNGEMLLAAASLQLLPVLPLGLRLSSIPGGLKMGLVLALE